MQTETEAEAPGHTAPKAPDRMLEYINVCARNSVTDSPRSKLWDSQKVDFLKINFIGTSNANWVGYSENTSGNSLYLPLTFIPSEWAHLPSVLLDSKVEISKYLSKLTKSFVIVPKLKSACFNKAMAERWHSRMRITYSGSFIERKLQSYAN